MVDAMPRVGCGWGRVPCMGWGWSGGVLMLTFLALARMVGATPRIGWGWGGGVAHMVDATPHMG